MASRSHTVAFRGRRKGQSQPHSHISRGSDIPSAQSRGTRIRVSALLPLPYYQGWLLVQWAEREKRGMR
eukprot:7709140-Pyramimonas_sp.AAC.1